MDRLWIGIGIVGAVVVLVLLIAFVCFRMAFYAAPRKRTDGDTIDLPAGAAYEPYHPRMRAWAQEMRALPCEEVSITSFDGLRLYGKYYEYAPDAPIELMFHGYRSCAERDLCGGVQRCFALGRNALIVDQRCSGRSDGRVITFGIREHRDCLCWLAFMQRRFGPEAKIILTGISMGAATVMMTADKPLPDNVIGILADCGYTSPRDIIRKVIGDMGLPVGLSYPFVRLGAWLYGGFDLEADSPLQAVSHSTRPIIFFHGEADDFVPCEMSRRLYEACPSKKQLVTVPDAGHGLSYPAARQAYLEAAGAFFSTEEKSR